MRKIANIPDIQKVLNQLLDTQTLKNTKDNDMHGLRISNASPGIKPNDYVIVSQITGSSTFQAVQTATYTMTFSIDAPSDGQVTAPYVAGNDRDGQIIDCWISSTVAPTSDCEVMFQINSVNILTSPIILPSGTKGPVHSGQFVQPIPVIGYDTTATMTVVTAGGVALLSGGIVVRKTK